MAKFSDLFDGTVVGTLATVSADNKPWGTPLHMAFSDNTVYWLSSPNAAHSRNIAERPDVCITIWSRDKTKGFDGLKGVYIQTQARALEGEDAEIGRQAFIDILGDDAPKMLLQATVYSAPIGEKSTTLSKGNLHYFSSDKTLDIAYN